MILETLRECRAEHLDLTGLLDALQGIRDGRYSVVRRRGETASPFASQLLFGFTAAFLYDPDKVEHRDAQRSARPIDQPLLDSLLEPDAYRHLLDPRAAQQVEHRLRGVGRPPRSPEEAAEWLRTLGDLRPAECPPDVNAHLETLAASGRAVRWPVPGRGEIRWILAEEQPNYRAAFDPAAGPAAHAAASAILHRFLLTHALVGLADILERYPFERDWTERELANWVQRGRAVRLEDGSELGQVQWAVPDNLAAVQQSTITLLRREVPVLSAAQFADFVLRWQNRHPASQCGGMEGLRQVLGHLAGLALPMDLWERAVLPGRVPALQTRWLDELTTSGEWVWVLQAADGEAGEVAWYRRAELPSWPAPRPELDADAETLLVWEQLQQRGAQFVVDLAATTRLTPSKVQAALWRLARQGRVTNDRWSVLRRGAAAPVSSADSGRSARPSLRHLRRQRLQQPEGRWSALAWGTPDTAERAVAAAGRLLERYGGGQPRPGTA